MQPRLDRHLLFSYNVYQWQQHAPLDASSKRQSCVQVLCVPETELLTQLLGSCPAAFLGVLQRLEYSVLGA